MFPTEDYLTLCTQPEVAEMLRELWEPKWGDLVLATDWQVLGSRVDMQEEWRQWLVVRVWESAGGETRLAVYAREKAYPPTVHKAATIPLLRIDQLIELLEERGLVPGVIQVGDEKGNKTGYYAVAWHPINGEIFHEAEAPDPVSALLLALVEVMKRE